MSEVPYDAPGDGSPTRRRDPSTGAADAPSGHAASPGAVPGPADQSWGPDALPPGPTRPASPPVGPAGPPPAPAPFVPQQSGPPPEQPSGLPPTAFLEGPSRGFGPPPQPEDQFDEFGLPPSAIPGPRFGESPVGSSPINGPQLNGPRLNGPHVGPRPDSPPLDGSSQYGGRPISGMPVSGHPVGAHPVSGSPRQPVSGPPEPAFDTRPSWEPRIVPSPPPQRGKLLVGLLAGLAAGLLVFGATGYFVGRASAARATAPTASPTSVAPSGPVLSAYETAQQAANKPIVPSSLDRLAAPWLPYVGSCVRNPVKLLPGEKARVRCEHGDVVVTFVEYTSIAERDKVRISNLAKSVDARQLTPGVVGQREGPSPSGRTAGDYVEYAYTVQSGRAKLPVAALWWDDASAPVGAYMIAFWKDKLGASWEPLRGLWAEHA